MDARLNNFTRTSTPATLWWIWTGVALLGIGVSLAFLWPLARRNGAQSLHAPESNLGKPVSSFSLQDLEGRTVSLQDFPHARAVVVVFTAIDCPVGNLYLPRIIDIFKRYESQAVTFLAINSNAHESVDQIKAHVSEYKLPFPVLKDTENRLADLLRVDRVGEVLVLDAAQVLRYRGAVDDQYARGAYKKAPTRAFLDEALEAILSGQPVHTTHTTLVSCPIDRVRPARIAPAKTLVDATEKLRRSPSPEPQETGPVTFATHIAPLMTNRCQSCHRAGEVAPFSLVSYDDARRHGAAIRDVIDAGLMPPWGADPRHGRYANDRSLSDQERALFLAWVDQGMPAGDLAQVASSLEPRMGWTIGTPDYVFEMSEQFDVPASGVVPIQKFLVATNLTEDVWVQAAQALPGDSAVVHHICVFVVDPETMTRKGNKDWETKRKDRPELVCYAPGDMPCIYPAGVAKKLPAGSILEIQVHYQPVGVPRFDRTSVGIRFARQPVKKMAITRSAAHRDLVLAPGVSNVELSSSYTLLEAGELLSLTPHMHYRGRDFQFEAVFPDGHREILLHVPHYDFNWQDVYRLAEPRFLPRGTRMECVAHFDNSAMNPVNPDPTQTVRWGEQSTDEMMIGYFDYCVDVEPTDTQAQGSAASPLE